MKLRLTTDPSRGGIALNVFWAAPFVFPLMLIGVLRACYWLVGASPTGGAGTIGAFICFLLGVFLGASAAFACTAGQIGVFYIVRKEADE